MINFYLHSTLSWWVCSNSEVNQTMLMKKSITIKKHRTSISLEKEFWDALKIIALQTSSTVDKIISDVDLKRNTSLASSTRVFILQYFLEKS